MPNAVYVTPRPSDSRNQSDFPFSAEVARMSNKLAVLYIDHQCLTRECVGQQLMMLLPGTDVITMPTIDDISKFAGDVNRFSVGIIHKHGLPSEDQELTRQLLQLAELIPNLPFVLLSDTEEADDIVKAFGLGVRGYIPTNLPIKQAVEAIRLVGAGGSYVPSSVLSLSTLRSVTQSYGHRKEHDCVERFTPRQMEVLRRLWQGKQNKTIAYDLDMCESTVKVHIRHIMKKLNARNRTQVVLLTRSLNENGGANVEI